MREKIQKIVKGSLFAEDPLGGVFYFILYNLVPLVSIIAGLTNGSSTDTITAVNMYILLLISSINCLCDIRSRRQYTNASGIRLFIIFVVNFVMMSYALFETLFILSTQNLNKQVMWICLIYGIQFILVVFDLFVAYYLDIVQTS